MNMEIVRSRFKAVMKRDSVTSTQYDFLATHVPMKRLQLLSSFEVQPAAGQFYDEEYVYQNDVSNPDNAHQMILVYGVSGTGKSHLIRWFETKYKLNKPNNEVVLFISRSSNTLKSTIKQLLEMPEVQDLKNRDVYDRLLNATIEIEKKEFLSKIYHEFIVLIHNDIENNKFETNLSKLKKKRLDEYLRSSSVEEQLTLENGPIERIYSKIAENTVVEVGVKAEFKPEDFLDRDFNDRMQEEGDLSRTARVVIDTLNTDDGEDLAIEYADYLNKMVAEVIQRCTGIQQGDFGEIFKEIRKELRKTNRNLTLFIEDITSMQGLDEALLDALFVHHTGAEEGLCRISSIIGSTSAYIKTSFKQNHLDRVTQYVYIPVEPFDQESLYTFFGHYLNALSLPKEKLIEWVNGGAHQSEMPICEAENDVWDTCVINGKNVSLYPFTKNAIRSFYRFRLKEEEQIPRYFLQKIMEPVILDIMNDKQNFPNENYNFVEISSQLLLSLSQQIPEHQAHLRNRLLRFLMIWGNGEPVQVMIDGVMYYAGVNEKILGEFEFPHLSFKTVQAETQVKVPDLQIIQSEVPKPAENKDLKLVKEKLLEWVSGNQLDISSNAGIVGIMRNAKNEWSSYLKTAIDWEVEDVPYEIIRLVLESRIEIIGLENTFRGNKGIYTISASADSSLILTAFCKYILLGNRSWNYSDAQLDLYSITSWTYKNKKAIVAAVKQYVAVENYTYAEPGICVEIIRQALNGEYHDTQLKNIEVALYRDKKNIKKQNSHVAEWNSLLSFIYSNNRIEDTKDRAKAYYHIQQGTRKNDNLFIDTKRLNKAVQKVRETKLELDVTEDLEKMQSPQLKAAYEIYSDVAKRVSVVAEKEYNKAKEYLEAVEKCFGEKEIMIDDLGDIQNDLGTIIDLVNDTQINVSPIDISSVITKKNDIISAVKTLNKVTENSSCIEKLLLFSDDPMNKLEVLLRFITSLEKYLEKLDEKLTAKETELTGNNSLGLTTDYSKEIDDIQTALDTMGGF